MSLPAAARPPFESSANTNSATLGSYLARSLVTLVIPQGYTLSIAGSFAMAVGRYGPPLWTEALGFVAGAVAAFIVLSVVVVRNLRGGIVATPIGLAALMNVTPVLVVTGVLAITELIPSPQVGYPAAGLSAAGGYIVLVSLLFRIVGRSSLTPITEAAASQTKAPPSPM